MKYQAMMSAKKELVVAYRVGSTEFVKKGPVIQLIEYLHLKFVLYYGCRMIIILYFNTIPMF